MFLRFVKMLIRSNRQIEDAKVALFSHKTFSLQDSFRLFDVNENGLITANEISHLFSTNQIEPVDAARLVDILDKDDDGSIDLQEWIGGLKPMRPIRGAEPASPNLPVEQRQLAQSGLY